MKERFGVDSFEKEMNKIPLKIAKEFLKEKSQELELSSDVFVEINGDSLTFQNLTDEEAKQRVQDAFMEYWEKSKIVITPQIKW